MTEAMTTTGSTVLVVSNPAASAACVPASAPAKRASTRPPPPDQPTSRHCASARAWVSSAVHYPLTPALLAAFVLSLITGFFVGMFMSCAFAVLAFWSTQVANLCSLFYGVGQFLSGWIAPLALFPENIRNVAYLLPFRSIISFPLEILMGRLAWDEIALGFAVSGMWIVVFLFSYRLLWHIGLRRYEAVGA